MGVGVRRLREPALILGPLFEDDFFRLELLDGVQTDSAQTDNPGVYRCKLSATRPDSALRQTYYNLRPPQALAGLLAERVSGWRPGNVIPLHRLVAAVSGQAIPEGHQVHHRNHNHLDNRASNLTVVSAEAHTKLHQRHPRLAELRQAHLFGESLTLTVTVKCADAWLLLRLSARAAGHQEPHQYSPDATTFGNRKCSVRLEGAHLNLSSVGANHRQTVVTGPSEVVPGDAIGVMPDFKRRILLSKELQRFGLRARAALRARKMLSAVKKSDGRALAGDLVARCTAKMDCERSAWNTLDWLVSGGLIEKTESQTYRLTERAWRVIPASFSR